ncbi:LCP family protein [Arthrobacter rhombi]|uniref:LCP family protein n=1 Tax=Arthrobacter rhombi TaxID=71253 RepID=UPI003FD40CFC
MSQENMDLAFGEPEHKKKHPVRATIITLLSLVVIAALVAGGYVFSLAKNFDSNSQKIESAFPTNDDRPEKSATGAMNILLLGSDSGGGSGSTENLKGVPNSGRSDTIMLVHIPDDRKGAYVTSIMRDTWVPIPGEGTHKINSAFSYGGVPKAVETIESLLDTRIDHVASVDMEGFKGLTDALGGVDVNVPIAFSTNNGKKDYHFDAGTQHLDGDNALAFVRERKSFKDGDYQRVKDQQIFIKAVMNKVLSRGTLTNPGKLSDVVNELSPFVAVDDTLDAAALGKLGISMAGIRSSDMHFFTLPNQGTGRSNDGQSIVLPDDAAIDELSTALKDDTVDEFVQSNGL